MLIEAGADVNLGVEIETTDTDGDTDEYSTDGYSTDEYSTDESDDSSVDA